MSAHINSVEQYDSVTRGATGRAIVKCGAQWCSPCKKIAPEFDALAIKYPDVSFYSLDIEEVSAFQDAEVITKLPTFLLFNGGSPAGLIEGSAISVVEKYLQQL